MNSGGLIRSAACPREAFPSRLHLPRISIAPRLAITGVRSKDAACHEIHLLVTPHHLNAPVDGLGIPLFGDATLLLPLLPLLPASLQASRDMRTLETMEVLEGITSDHLPPALLFAPLAWKLVPFPLALQVISSALIPRVTSILAVAVHLWAVVKTARQLLEHGTLAANKADVLSTLAQGASDSLLMAKPVSLLDS